MTGEPLRPGSGDVRVWHARVDDAWADPSRAARAMTWLTPADQARHDRYRHDADRRMFLLGRVMARRLVATVLDVAPTAWDWREGRYGRPEVADPAPGVWFNLAHSAGLVVCAISTEGDVGADVEHRERPATDPQVVRRFCSPTEIHDIEAHGPDGWRDRFLKYWTLKEAYLKARGLGIAVHLADVSFTIGHDQPPRVAFLNSLADQDTNWAFALSDAADTHFIAAAAPADRGRSPRFTIAPFPADLLP